MREIESCSTSHNARNATRHFLDGILNSAMAIKRQ